MTLAARVAMRMVKYFILYVKKFYVCAADSSGERQNSYYYECGKRIGWGWTVIFCSQPEDDASIIYHTNMQHSTLM